MNCMGHVTECVAITNHDDVEKSKLRDQYKLLTTITIQWIAKVASRSPQIKSVTVVGRSPVVPDCILLHGYS